MTRKQFLRLGALLGTAISMTLTPSARGQSVDALLDKLVDKGVLSIKEANALKQDSDEGFTKAFQAKTGMPDWVSAYKFGGDFRGRFEQNNSENSAYIERDRYRYRLRLGVSVTMLENFEVGARLASGNPLTNPGGTLVGGSPITANQDLSSLDSRKFLWIDAAYGKWTAIKSPDWTLSATIGKMENPFLLSPMIWDADINPEGGALQLAHNFSDTQAIKLNGGFFVLDELNQPKAVRGFTPDANHDPYLYGAQLLWESKWTPKFDTALGVAALDIVHSKDALSSQLQPFYNSGNSRNANGFLVNNYNPIIGTASATYKFDSLPLYPAAFPVKVSGEYMANPGARNNNVGYRAGLTLGKAGIKRGWEINYRYQRLEADAWFDALVDDDNGGYYATGNPQMAGTGKLNGWYGGTNVKGHLMQGTYSFTDFLNFTFTYYLNDLIINAPGKDSSAGHFMADVMWKF